MGAHSESGHPRLTGQRQLPDAGRHPLRILRGQPQKRRACSLCSGFRRGGDELTADGRVHDDYRIDYYRDHILAMDKAINNGVDLIAYTTWGCIDLVSAGTGEMRKRYGFIYVDKHDDGTGTMKRSPKDSFYWYQKVIQSNGQDLD